MSKVFFLKNEGEILRNKNKRSFFVSKFKKNGGSSIFFEKKNERGLRVLNGMSILRALISLNSRKWSVKRVKIGK